MTTYLHLNELVSSNRGQKARKTISNGTRDVGQSFHSEWWKTSRRPNKWMNLEQQCQERWHRSFRVYKPEFDKNPHSFEAHSFSISHHQVFWPKPYHSSFGNRSESYFDFLHLFKISDIMPIDFSIRSVINGEWHMMEAQRPEFVDILFISSL